MSDFTHSVVLFTGDDGLPIEFNIQNTVEKTALKAMIEHGGGNCTLDANAVHLVSPGTSVINVDTHRKIVSSRYVFDCVKQNYLLEMDDYKVQINEIEASDFSEDNSLLCGRKSSENENSEDIIDRGKSVSPQTVDLPKSNHAFDFESTSKIELKEDPNHSKSSDNQTQKTSSENLDRSHVSTTPEDLFLPIGEKSVASDVAQKVSNTSEEGDIFVDAQSFGFAEEVEIAANEHDVAENNPCVSGMSLRESPVNAGIVTSSDPCADDLDQFDNMILNKSEEKANVQENDSLSQSYTVSSSADAQVPSAKPSPHDTSAEIFEGEANVPDSPSQFSERQLYIKELEKEIENILQKPSPRSLQDKIVMVKYICIVKKLAPDVVLKTLQNF